MRDRLSTRLWILVSLFVSFETKAAYNSQDIMNYANSEQTLFQISDWISSPKGYKAESPLMWFSFIVGENVSQISSPYINPKQKREAQARCESLASHILKPSTEQTIQLAKVIHRATQFHIPRSISMNSVRFDIAPTMEGVYVKLICTFSKLP